MVQPQNGRGKWRNTKNQKGKKEETFIAFNGYYLMFYFEPWITRNTSSSQNRGPILEGSFIKGFQIQSYFYSILKVAH